MADLHRLTADYVESEDRIRLRGALASGQCVVVWISRRLADRLVRALVKLLAEQGHTLPSGPALAASAPLAPEPPVEAMHPEAQWLALAVDIAPRPGVVFLSFRAKEHSARIRMDGGLLRRWLDGLRDLYIAAEWPLDPWAGWSVDRHSHRQPPGSFH